MSCSSWGHEALGIPALWERGLSGRGVRVGHLDTGVDGAHPALAECMVAFREFDAQGYPMPPGPARDSSGSAGHGTHTAGLIAGQDIGAAPGAQLCSGAVIEGGNAKARLCNGLAWLAECDVRVISMPLGWPANTEGWIADPDIRDALVLLRQQGVLVVCPVGNRGAGQFTWPGNEEFVLTVGALGEDGQAAKFSGSLNFGPRRIPLKPDILAPGANTISARTGGGLAHRSGTSMASAYVAGLAALLFEAFPGATPDEVQAALVASALPLPDGQDHRARAGLVNVQAALKLLEMGHVSAM